jgi:hypothetical protein
MKFRMLTPSDQSTGSLACAAYSSVVEGSPSTPTGVELIKIKLLIRSG